MPLDLNFIIFILFYYNKNKMDPVLQKPTSKKFIIIVSSIILFICISMSIGMSLLIKQNKEEEPTSTTASASTTTSTSASASTSASTTVSPPNLLNNTIYWQTKNDCGTGQNCGGLVFIDINSSRPWNKYYQFSCEDSNGNESSRTQVFGPVRYDNTNYGKPKIRLQTDGGNPCGNNKLKIYRGNIPSQLSQIKVNNFGNNAEFNYKDAIFTDSLE